MAGYGGGLQQPSWDDYLASQIRNQRSAGVGAGQAEAARITEVAPAKLKATHDANADMLAMLAPYLNPNTSSSSSSSSGGGSGVSAASGYPQIAPPSLTALQGSVGNAAQVPNAPLVDTSQAEANSFAMAKDQVGSTGRAALTGLRSELAGRGMLGSGAEYRTTANVANAGQEALGNVSRQQAITRADKAQENENTNYAGNITQRGQTMAANTAAATTSATLSADMAKTGYEGAIAQRSQDIQAQEAANNLKFQQAQSQMASQQNVLAGLMSALKSGDSAY